MQSNTSTLNRIRIIDSDSQKVAEFPSNSIDHPVKASNEDLVVSEPVTVEKVCEKLEKYGGAIVRNYMTDVDTDAISKDVQPLLDEQKDDPRLYPKETIRVTGVCGKSKVTAENMLTHPLGMGVSDRFLGKRNCFWIGDKLAEGYSPPQHSSSIVFSIGPGAKSQVLHRDDMDHHNIRKHMDTYQHGVETSIGISVALSETTKENGATRFIPGSHMWDHLRQPRDEEAIQVELKKGDSFFMLASCYHAGSANVTEDKVRTIIFLFMTQGTQRQKENIMLGTPVEYFKSLSSDALKMLGLTLSEPFCGLLELQDPLVRLKPGFVRESNYTAVYNTSEVHS